MAPRARRSSGHRIISGLGVLLIVCGLGWFGWVGWQYYGTSWVAEREQASIIEDLKKSWTKEGGKAKAKVVVSKDGGPSGTPVYADAYVQIPKFGSTYAVPVVDGVDDYALSLGYGHFKESAGVGGVGNYALAAHRITHGEPLRDMPSLAPGDEVRITTKDATYVYVLDSAGDALTVDFKASWVLGDVPDNPKPKGVEPLQKAGQRLLTLTTCSELFHTDNRLVAFGHLDHVER